MWRLKGIGQASRHLCMLKAPARVLLRCYDVAMQEMNGKECAAYRHTVVERHLTQIAKDRKRLPYFVALTVILLLLAVLSALYLHPFAPASYAMKTTKLHIWFSVFSFSLLAGSAASSCAIACALFSRSLGRRAEKRSLALLESL